MKALIYSKLNQDSNLNHYDILIPWTVDSIGLDTDSRIFYLLRSNNDNQLRESYLDHIQNLIRLIEASNSHHVLDKATPRLLDLSLLLQQSSYRSPTNLDLIKLVSLGMLLSSGAVKSLDVLNLPVRFRHSLSSLCDQHNVALGPCKFTWSIKDSFLLVFLLQVFRGFSTLFIFTLERLPLVVLGIKRRFNLYRWILLHRNHDNLLTFANYFFGIKGVTSKGGIETSAWSNLSHELLDNGFPQLWVHLWIGRLNGDNSLKAHRKLNSLHTDHMIRHTFLDEWMSIRSYYRLIIFWMTSVLVTLSAFRKISSCSISGIRILEVLSWDWFRSFVGAEAISNLYYRECSSLLTKSFPARSHLVIAQENQPWELCLGHGWHLHNIGAVLGYPHASIRFWDLRYSNEALSFPPRRSVDLYLSQGDTWTKSLKGHGIDASRIVPVESLRYSTIKPLSSSTDSCSILIVLVGDYDVDASLLMIRLLSKSYFSSSPTYQIAYKPHPGCPQHHLCIVPDNWHVVTDPISLCLANATVVVAYSGSSALFDILRLGVLPVVIDDPNTLNMSPVLDVYDSDYVSCVNDLQTEINRRLLPSPSSFVPPVFINEDIKLRNWVSLFTQLTSNKP